VRLTRQPRAVCVWFEPANCAQALGSAWDDSSTGGDEFPAAWQSKEGQP